MLSPPTLTFWPAWYSSRKLSVPCGSWQLEQCRLLFDSGLAPGTPGVLDVPPFTGLPDVGAADSFFNVFFEIEIGGFLLLQNLSPVAIGGRITHKPPPGEELGNIITTDPVELFEPSGESTGFFLRRTTAIAEPGSLAILGLGLAGLGVLRRRQLGA